MPQPIVIAHHLIWTAYGWWLPNDPRGSGSKEVHANVLKELGDLHQGRKLVQPSSHEIRNFYAEAAPLLQHELLIFDEVVTGFRFAYGGAQTYYGVTPDLCTLGKAIGGGFPLAAIAGRADIMALFDKGAVAEERFVTQIGTLSGNPVAAAAGLKTLEILKRPGAYERIFQTGRALIEGYAEILKRARIRARVVGDARPQSCRRCRHPCPSRRGAVPRTLDDAP